MISRRHFLKAVAGIVTVYPFKKAFAFPKSERTLNMFNIHTGERIDIKYFQSGIYNQEALNIINNFLRCHFANEVKTIDINIINLLSDITDIAGRGKEVQVISGYRSKKYNEYLINLGKRVSRNSLHLSGTAIDFAIPEVGNDKLYHIAGSFKKGGVGLYSSFVHIDIGRTRNWKTL